MQLIDPIPDPIYKKLNPLLEADEEIRIALESDIDAAGHFNPRWLVMTDRRVMTLGLNGNDQDLEVPLADLTKVQIEPLVGGSSLEVSTAEDTIPLITYSQSRTDKFIEASRGIEQFIEDKPFLVKTTFPKVTCEKCGRRWGTRRWCPSPPAESAGRNAGPSGKWWDFLRVGVRRRQPNPGRHC